MLTRLLPRADVSDDPLRLAAAQRAQRAVERQIAQADLLQEAQPGADLLQDHRADGRS